jgi:hypothetical protein
MQTYFGFAVFTAAFAAEKHNDAFNLQEEGTWFEGEIEGPFSTYYCEGDTAESSFSCTDDYVTISGGIFTYYDDEESCMVQNGFGFGENEGTYYSFDCYYYECSGILECEWNIWEDEYYDSYFSCSNNVCTFDCDSYSFGYDFDYYCSDYYSDYVTVEFEL